MREHLRRPAEPMGEAWFMGDERRMFPLLLGNLEELSLEELREPLEEIASGNSSFGPLDEWTVWYRYLLGQLVPRHAERSFDSLYQHLVAAFIAVHPRGIDEPYGGFADDARQTLGRCLMDPSRWTGDRLAVTAPEDPFADGRRAAFEWTVACGDFSAGMFFCAKYLGEDELDGWLDSVFAIDCPLWITQLHSWLLAAHPLLAGRVVELAVLEDDPWTNVVWHGAHVLKGDFSGVHNPTPSPLPLLSPERREAVLAAARRHVSEARYFAWLDAIKPHAYLQTVLGDMPSRFADEFNIA
ncbi:hypothetical protein [Agrilutibacter solisilvae]|uniref:Uncharacterized protein n=1 Tax=Agrilutibacter solisilvae TaxID=2763317 RepID=A0A974Y1J5_9GAMM|nr:hypothetical protein [Lysobacter solisilvae]QSX78705.1 hypothetical protein I8J32_001830 [Lysobacter solisilvae]